MPYYEKHVFFCANQKEGGKKCCGAGGLAMAKHAKSRLSELGLQGEGKIRVSHTGCLGRCERGPCIVIYPEGVWYTYANQSEVDEIIDSHLVNQQVAEHLLIDKENNA